jgi:protocadherin alpha
VATDGGVPPQSSNVSVQITLIDYNDNPPRFLQDSYITEGT